MKIALPAPLAPHGAKTMDCESLVLVGANGSGKSRLGIWIEQSQGDERLVHRISAQRSLVFQPAVAPKTEKEAEQTLYYGQHLSQQDWNEAGAQMLKNNRVHRRWQGRPASFLLNDFDHVLTALMSKQRARDADYVRGVQATGAAPLPVPPSALEDTLRVFKSVMPQRQLNVRHECLWAQGQNLADYSPIEMSDGERVALYLIGQVMCAPNQSIVVIDEPELHLHRSIQARLWDELERARPDCLLVYITHDLEFAATRKGARMVWVKSFDGSLWDWQEVESIAEVPTDLQLSVLGSRRTALFVEGRRLSLDSQLYEKLFPEHLIVPMGSCHAVAGAVRAFRKTGHLHYSTALGLIDRDVRSDESLQEFAKGEIHACPVAEVENLLCLPCVLSAVARRHGKDPVQVVEKATRAISAKLQQDLDAQAITRAKWELNETIKLDERAKTREELVTAVAGVPAKADAGAAYDRAVKVMQSAIAEGTLEAILRVFNRKGLIDLLQEVTGLTPQGYRDLVLTLLSEPKEPLRGELSRLFPGVLGTSLAAPAGPKETQAAKATG